MKVVTKLLDNICLCRDLVTERNEQHILHKLHIFTQVTQEVKRQVLKWLDAENYELDFTAQDLYELSDEIYNFIAQNPENLTFGRMLQEINKNDVIDDKIITKETNKIANRIKIDTVLRECYEILAYMAIVYTMWEINKEK